VIWGFAFVISKVGLKSFTPPQLTALRFLIAAVPALWLPRPSISWRLLIAIGLTLFTGQFLLQFFGIAKGMPAGLTAVVVQTQALFTVLFAAITLGDRPTARQLTGMSVALGGLVMIALTLGIDVPAIGFALTLASAISWSVGNVLVKRLHNVEMLQLMVWVSIVPPLPALALSAILDGPVTLLDAIANASWAGIGAVLYLGLLSTVMAYAIWGNLLRSYSTGTVAPFALLAPCVGAVTSSLVFGEAFGPLRLAGILAMLAGVAIVALPSTYFDILHVRRR
jgi:O-acetylserine/cysteine efflux transporter